MSRRFKFPHVKRTKAKGRYYYYFRTGRFNDQGNEILAPLPAPDASDFGDKYAGYLSAKTKRANVKGEITVTELIELYKKSPHFTKLAAGSQRIYGIYLEQFRAMFPTAPANAIRREWVTRLIDSKAATPGAANSLLRTIAALYRWARKRGHVTANPTIDIEQLETGEHEPWPQWLLEGALRADDARVRLAVHLLYYTALRLGDALALRWTDIRDDRIQITPQKTRRHKLELSIPLHDELAKELALHERGIGFILASQTGRPLDQETIRRHLQAWADGHGVKVVPHGLRKNAVNALLEAGCSAAEAAAISGQSLRMIEHYAKTRSQPNLATAAIYKWNRGGKS